MAARTNDSAAAVKAYKAMHSRCEVCGWHLNNHGHHMRPLSCGGSDDSANLITLCPNHHAVAHAELLNYACTIEVCAAGVSRKWLAGVPLRTALVEHLIACTPRETNMLLREVRKNRLRRAREDKKLWDGMSDEQRKAQVRLALSTYDTIEALA